MSDAEAYRIAVLIWQRYRYLRSPLAAIWWGRVQRLETDARAERDRA